MNALQLRLQQRLQERRQQSLYRQRLTLTSAQGAEVQIGNERLLCFCSNDYLGLANHPQVIASLQESPPPRRPLQDWQRRFASGGGSQRAASAAGGRAG